MQFTGDVIYWRWALSDGDIFEEDIWLIKMKTFDCSILLGNLFVAKDELFESQCYETLHRRVKHLCNRHLKRRSNRDVSCWLLRRASNDEETVGKVDQSNLLSHGCWCLKYMNDAPWRCNLLEMRFTQDELQVMETFLKKTFGWKRWRYWLFHPVKSNLLFSKKGTLWKSVLSPCTEECHLYATDT